MDTHNYTAHISKRPDCSAKDMQKFSSVQRYCGINFSNPEFQTVMHQGRLISSATAKKMNRIPQIVASVLMSVEWNSSHANICPNTDVLCVLIPHCLICHNHADACLMMSQYWWCNHHQSSRKVRSHKMNSKQAVISTLLSMGNTWLYTICLYSDCRNNTTRNCRRDWINKSCSFCKFITANWEYTFCWVG